MKTEEFKKALLEKTAEVSDVDISKLEIAFSVSEALEIFQAATHTLVEVITGFSANYFNVLRMLYVYAPDGVPLSKIAEHVGITRASMTQIINNLEGRGLVARVENPKDKRSFLVSLTPKGVEEIKTVFVSYHTAISRLVEKAGTSNLQNMIDHLLMKTNEIIELQRES